MELKNPRNLKQIIKIMRESGVNTLEQSESGFKITLASNALFPSKALSKKEIAASEAAQKLENAQREADAKAQAMQALLWSTPDLAEELERMQ